VGGNPVTSNTLFPVVGVMCSCLCIRWRDPGGGELYCAAVSPDCRILAAGGEGRLLLFDRRTGKLLASFDETHREAVAQVGRKLVAIR